MKYFYDFLALLFAVAVGIIFLSLIVQWASGCGEHYIDSKGETHILECK